MTHLIPGGTDDMLWWAQSGVHNWLLDGVVGVLYEILGMYDQAADLSSTNEQATGFMEVINQVGGMVNKLAAVSDGVQQLHKSSWPAVSCT